MGKQIKIRFDSKEEFDAYLNLEEDSTVRYHSFAEDKPWEYPCIMTAVKIKNDIDSINDIYYCFVYKRNLITDYESR